MQVSIKNQTFTVADEPKDFWGWVQEGRYDREWDIITTYLRPEHTFIDLGAWVGSHSLLASTIAHRTLAIEPDPVAYQILLDNITLSRAPIEPYCVAIGPQGLVTLGSGFLGASTTRRNPAAGGGIGAWEEGHKFDIQSTTLRQFTQGVNALDPLFLKIDVEGSEEEIVQDFEWFEQHRPTMYLELHPWWWTRSDTDERLNKISDLYKHNQEVTGNSWIFTNERY